MPNWTKQWRRKDNEKAAKRDLSCLYLSINVLLCNYPDLVRVYWICSRIDLSLLILTFHCLQMTWVSSLLPRLLISDQSWMVSLHHIFRRRRSLIWHLNPAILYCLIFQCQTAEATCDMITSGKKKSCILDPIPVTLLSACLDPLLPVITNMVNLSLRNWIFCRRLENCCGTSIYWKSLALIYFSRIFDQLATCSLCPNSLNVW